ncbi:SPOR domain-containing protein [Oxalobacter vibrioformis]|uniref:SPOR domain-containing protein n=1 Tax=Oxalobacter vibrioformis TaxID=933080 RepID=A0A9E9M082_9BURK|nr:SPOR domain-containing protein [Oxalobacter vibrioformis]WAW10794.1 SPOR domain-containing protein [Oxalobacter vibrioformis]
MSRFPLFRRKKPETADQDLPYTDGGGFTPDNAGRKKPGKPADVDDPILPEKKRARRRLVGAVTITLAAIIVLPMIFDSEPQTVSQDLLIDIPSRDKPSQTVSREPVKKKAEEKPAVVAGSDKPAGDSSTPVASDKKNTTAKLAADDKTDTKPVAKTDVKPESKPDAKPESKSDTKTDTAKKTDDPIGQLIAQQQTDAKAADAKADEQGKFVIQVAAVSSQDKAKELQDRLQKAGLTSYTQKVALKDGGERIRIRIGPLPTRMEVNSTCAKLSQLKLPCTLVN